MLTRTQEQVSRLLQEGIKTKQEIALLIGVNMDTVLLIESQIKPQPRPDYQYCPDCGYLVTMPCIACQQTEKDHHVVALDNHDADIHLDLKSHHLDRYVKLRHIPPSKE